MKGTGFIIALVSAACENRSLYFNLEGKAGFDLHVFFDWTDAPGADPVSMSLYLFLLDGGGVLRYEFADRKGGSIRVPFGVYGLIREPFRPSMPVGGSRGRLKVDVAHWYDFDSYRHAVFMP